ncbi:ParA family protein [Candidatus Woesearchaeota archaeon]|nr:ParA family protein [Candidatus Woesearchaeota archaeon]
MTGEKLRKIAIINQKGGVGKTTTTINLAAGLAKRDFKVLILDLDPQGNISTSLCVKSEKNMYHILVDDVNPKECIVNVQENIDVITSDQSLEKAEMILAGETSRETVLRRVMDGVNNYDFVILDCPPSLGLLNQNALLYAREAFIPASTDFLGINALKKMQIAIEALNDIFNHKIFISAVIPTMYDRRNKTCIEHYNELQRGYSDVLTNPIRVNSKLKEAPSQGKSIFDYANSSRGAKDYEKLVEIIIDEGE